ncbi:MAG: ubiquitin-like domain-containing protein [Chloroflexota bacterium]|nr:ubiquitin-like domain-containing protein [Chloroflexota bacterium]
MAVAEPTLSPEAKPESGSREWNQPIEVPFLSVVVTLVLAVAILGALVWGYFSTAAPVTISIDGLTARVNSHQSTVGDLLGELQVTLTPEDRITTPLGKGLLPGLVIEIVRARPVVVQGDSRERHLRTHLTTVGGVLNEAGITTGPHDELTLAGQPANVDTLLPLPELLGGRQFSGIPEPLPWQGTELSAVEIAIVRAVPLVLHDEGPSVTLWTTASTIGEALTEHGLQFFIGDRVRPGLGTPASAGAQIFLDRSKPVSVRSGDGIWRTRTRAATVSDLLTENGLVLAGLDRVEPSLETVVTDDLEVTITQVEHRFDVEEEVTPYSTIWQADPELEIDQRRMENEGVRGIQRWRYRTVLEDDEPVDRFLEDHWLAQQPITRVLKYGTDIIPRELETTEGTLTYWRKVRMFATSYSADEAGTPVDAPYYGLTRSGTPVGYGVAAVDPSVVKLGSKVYVPGYGVADALDTGSAIKGRWIDLAYEEGQLVPWSRCVDVYLLTPEPPSYQIEYFLPDRPRVRCLQQ